MPYRFCDACLGTYDDQKFHECPRMTGRQKQDRDQWIKTLIADALGVNVNSLMGDKQSSRVLEALRKAGVLR